MKASAVSAVSLALVSILLCPMAMAAPPMPDDVKMVEPDPSLPKEIAGFWGKWEGRGQMMTVFLIIEKIDGEKASVYRWRSGFPGFVPEGWDRLEANVAKEYGKYKLWWRVSEAGNSGINELTLKGKYVEYYYRTVYVTNSVQLTRVP